MNRKQIDYFKERMESVLPQVGFTSKETHTVIKGCLGILSNLEDVVLPGNLFDLEEGSLLKITQKTKAEEARKAIVADPGLFAEVVKSVRARKPQKKNLNLGDIEFSSRMTFDKTGKRPKIGDGAVLYGDLADRGIKWHNINRAFMTGALGLKGSGYSSLLDFLNKKQIGEKKYYNAVMPSDGVISEAAIKTVFRTGTLPRSISGHDELPDGHCGWYHIIRSLAERKTTLNVIVRKHLDKEREECIQDGKIHACDVFSRAALHIYSTNEIYDDPDIEKFLQADKVVGLERISDLKVFKGETSMLPDFLVATGLVKKKGDKITPSSPRIIKNFMRQIKQFSFATKTPTF